MTSQSELNLCDFINPNSKWIDEAYSNALQEAENTGKVLRLQPGVFSFEKPFERQMSRNAPVIRGCGIGKTRFDFPNAKDGEVQMHYYGDTDWYDFEMSDFEISSSHDGTLLKIGKDDCLDPLNCAWFSRLGIFNGKPGAGNSVGLDVGYLVNSNVNGVRSNCFANGQGANYGTSFLVRQMEFTNFGSCSFGNASYGIRFVQGFSFGNVFSAIDIENVNICVKNESDNVGLTTFMGGQFSLFNYYMVQASQGFQNINRFRFINPNIQTQPGSQRVAPGTNGVDIQQ